MREPKQSGPAVYPRTSAFVDRRGPVGLAMTAWF